jgi:hypothetical protein
MHLLQRGLEALERLPASNQNRSLRLQLSALLGPALIGVRGPNAAETRAIYSAAYELCRELPEEPSHFPICWGWWRLAADGQEGVERAEALLQHAASRTDPGLMLQAHHCSWASYGHVGAFDRCREHTEAGLAIYHATDYTHHARLYGNHDAKSCAHGKLSQLFWMQGRLSEAKRQEAESLAWSERVDHLGSRIHAMGLTLLHRVYRREYKEVFDRSNALIALTSEYGLVDVQPAALIFRGWVVATHQDPMAGLTMLEEGFARQREIATTEDFPVYLCLLAEALTAVGKPEEAVERIARERPEFDRIRLRVWIPELIRAQGEAMLAADPASVTQARAEAAELAETQGVPMLGLRIAVSEARLNQRLGALETAAGGLDRALGRMVEDDGSADLLVA